jgi:RHS repeat-associated protein
LLPSQAGGVATLPGTRLVGGGTNPLIAGYVAYSYDHLYRLTGTSGPIEAAAYAYDAVGNRTSKTPNGQSAITYTYDKADRILTAGGVAYTVDDNGNVTARGTEQLLYDQANRLRELRQNSATVATYAYNGEGSRISKTVGATTTPYTYDIRASVAKLLQDGERRYVWRPGLAYASDLTGNTLSHVYHTDGIDSGRVLTDAAGAVTDTKRTDAFGVPLYNQGSSSQPFGFAGEQRDAESGLMYLRARQYDPALGRLIQRDILRGHPAQRSTHNRYTYGLNNPLRYVDPTGMDEEGGDSEQADYDFLQGGSTDPVLSDNIYFQQQDDIYTGIALGIFGDMLDESPGGTEEDEGLDEYEERYGDLQEQWDTKTSSDRFRSQHQSRQEHNAEQILMNELTNGLSPPEIRAVHDQLGPLKGPDGRASAEDIKSVVDGVINDRRSGNERRYRSDDIQECQYISEQVQPN